MSQDLNPNPSTCSSLVIFMSWACERQRSLFLVLPSKSMSGKCAKLYTVATSNNWDHRIIACSCHIYLCAALCAHPVRGESLSVQRQLRGCNNIPSFLQWLAPIALSFCEGSTWHHFYILVKVSLCCYWKGRQQVRKVSICGGKQQ